MLVLLEKLSRESGKTVVIVTHNRDIARMSDRTILMKNGRIVEQTDNEAVVSAADIEW